MYNTCLLITIYTLIYGAMISMMLYFLLHIWVLSNHSSYLSASHARLVQIQDRMEETLQVVRSRSWAVRTHHNNLVLFLFFRYRLYIVRILDHRVVVQQNIERITFSIDHIHAYVAIRGPQTTGTAPFQIFVSVI